MAVLALIGINRDGLLKHKTLLKEAGVESLKTRRKLHRLTYLFKIKNRLTPVYLVNILLL
jgi:hypothetical protein